MSSNIFSYFMNVSETKEFLRIFMNTGIVPILWGHTGIGKTETVRQFAESIDYVLTVIHTSEIEPQDFVGLYKIIDGYTTNCAPNWLPKTIDHYTLPNGRTPKGHAIFLDEINRCHRDMRQSLQQFILHKRIHTWEAPENTILIAAANPPDKYECYEFDDALNNKLAHVKFRPTPEETLEYNLAKNGQDIFLDYLASDMAQIDLGEDDFEVPKLLLTPRIIDNMTLKHKGVKAVEEILKKPLNFQKKALATVMPKEKVAAFLSFYESSRHINYLDILNGKTTQGQIENLIKDGRLDVLSKLQRDLGAVFKTYEVGVTKEISGVNASEEESIKNLATFLKVCPSEMISVFMNELGASVEKKTSILKSGLFIDLLKETYAKFKKLKK